jgi:hypothetical protein
VLTHSVFDVYCAIQCKYYPEDGGKKRLRNVGVSVKIDMASYLKGLESS